MNDLHPSPFPTASCIRNPVTLHSYSRKSVASCSPLKQHRCPPSLRVFPCTVLHHRLTSRQLVGFIMYQNKTGPKRAELIEIKPESQTRLGAKTSQRDKLAIAINHAKWEAAAKWCKLKGVQFRIVTEGDIFHQGKKRR